MILAGSIVAAVFFAEFGAMAGAILGEISVAQRLDASWRTGKVAFWGRLPGIHERIANQHFLSATQYARFTGVLVLLFQTRQVSHPQITA